MDTGVDDLEAQGRVCPPQVASDGEDGRKGGFFTEPQNVSYDTQSGQGSRMETLVRGDVHA